MATIGAGIVRRSKRSGHFRRLGGGTAQSDKVTMTCGTAARQQLTYLTFISVREVDRCCGSYGSSLSCSRHGARSAASDASFIRDAAVVGGGGSGPDFRKAGRVCGWTHRVCACGGETPGGSPGPSQKPRKPISARSLGSCSSVYSRHVGKSPPGKCWVKSQSAGKTGFLSEGGGGGRLT